MFEHIKSGMHQLEEIEIELVASLDVHNCPAAVFYKEECLRHLSDILPQGLRWTIMRWGGIKTMGSNYTIRYILTEFGGIKLDPGFDESLSVGANTEFTVLGRKRYNLRCFIPTGKRESSKSHQRKIWVSSNMVTSPTHLSPVPVAVQKILRELNL